MFQKVIMKNEYSVARQMMLHYINVSQYIFSKSTIPDVSLASDYINKFLTKADLELYAKFYQNKVALF